MSLFKYKPAVFPVSESNGIKRNLTQEAAGIPVQGETSYVGLRIASSTERKINHPPHVIKIVRDILDVNRVKQGKEGYSNPHIDVGDCVIGVNGINVQQSSTVELRRLLSGPPDTVVKLSLRKSKEYTGTDKKEYEVSLLRHVADTEQNLDDTAKASNEIAKLHAEGCLLVKVVEAWVIVLPWLKYSARNQRIVSAALRKREEQIMRVCVHVLMLNRARNESRMRVVRDTNRQSRLLKAWCMWIRGTLDTKNRQNLFKCVQIRAASQQLRAGFASKLMAQEFRKSSYFHFKAWSQMIRRHRRMLRCCKDLTRRWNTSLLASKFRWWVNAFLNWLELRDSAGNLFQRVTFRLLSGALLEWSILLKKNRQLLVLGMRAMMRWNIFLVRHSMMMMIVRAKSKRRLMGVYSIVSSRWQSRRLDWYFCRLKDRASKRVALRNIKVRALMFEIRNVRVKYMQRWWDMTKDIKWNSKWANSKIHDSTRRTGREVLNCWRAHVQVILSYHKRNVLYCARAVKRRNHAHTAKCFDTWCGSVQNARLIRRGPSALHRKRRSRRLDENFVHWRMHVERQRRLVFAAAKIIARRDLISLSGYFDWLAVLTEKWKRISIWCDKKELSIMRWVFFHWCGFAERWVQRERRWNFTAFKMNQGLIKRTFQHWTLTHVETGFYRRTVKRWALRLCTQLTKGSWFRHWQGLIRHRNWRNRTLRFGRLHHKFVLAEQYFKMWLQRTEYRRVVWRVMRRIHVRWHAVLSTQVFYLWRRYLSRKSHVTALLQNVAIHRHFCFCANFFCLWAQAVQEREHKDLVECKKELRKKCEEVSFLSERLNAAEHLASIAGMEKERLQEELKSSKDESIAAYQLVESINVTAESSKSRIDTLVARLDEASYLYERLDETQNLVKELQALRRNSEDDINRLQLESNVANAEKDAVGAELIEVRQRLSMTKKDLSKVEIEHDSLKAQTEDLSSHLSRQCASLDLQVDKLEEDLLHVMEKSKHQMYMISFTKDAVRQGQEINEALRMDNQRLEADSTRLEEEIKKRLESITLHNQELDKDNQELRKSLAVVENSSNRDLQGLQENILFLENAVALEKRKKLGLILNDGTVDSILLIFDLDGLDLKDKELDFSDNIAQHVSYALGIQDPAWVLVSNLQSKGGDNTSGSFLKVRLKFGPGASSNGLLPEDAIDIIKAQTERPGSVLLSGTVGAKIKGVELSAFADVVEVVTTPRTKTSTATSPFSSPQTKNSKVESVRMKIKLGLDFRIAGTEGSSQRILFEQNVAQDIARATSIPSYCFDISKVSPGSVLVEVLLRASPTVPDPMAIARQLQGQVSDSHSVLRNGNTTRYTINITAESLWSRSGSPSWQSRSHSRSPPRPNHEEMEKILQSQDTLRKAEAALAEQAKIVEVQAERLLKQDFELTEAQKAIEAAQKAVESADSQKKALQAKLNDAQTNLDDALADLATQHEIADSVTVQVEKMSKRNAELNKEILEYQKRAEFDAQLHESLRKELNFVLSGQRSAVASTDQMPRGDMVLEMVALKQSKEKLQRELDDVSKQLTRCNEARNHEHEQAVLERQKLLTDKKDAVDRQQVVIDRLMQIIDTHRERRSKEGGGDDQVELLQQRASSAETALQESVSMYRALHMQMIRQEQEMLKIKGAVTGSPGKWTDSLDGDKNPTDALQHDLNLMRKQTRMACILKALEGILRRRRFSKLDVSFSCWANLTEENAFEKMLDANIGRSRTMSSLSSRSPEGSPLRQRAVTPNKAAFPSSPSMGFRDKRTTDAIGIDSKTKKSKSSPNSPFSSPRKQAVDIQHQSIPASLLASNVRYSPVSPPFQPATHFPRVQFENESIPQGHHVHHVSPSSLSKLASMSQGSPHISPLLSAKPSPLLASQPPEQNLNREKTLQHSSPKQSSSPSKSRTGAATIQTIPGMTPVLTFRDEVWQLIGLKLRDSKVPPFLVEHGNGLVDVFGVKQHGASYSNQLVEQGDTLLFVDSLEVVSLGADGILQRLRGEALSQVHLVFTSRRDSTLFRITVLRHARA